MTPDEANKQLNQHLQEMIQWHFSPETGCKYWLNWAKDKGVDPRKTVNTVNDLTIFEHFNDDLLKTLPQADLIPRAFEGKPYKVFETGGTTGMPKQRISWEDHLLDYTEFSNTLREDQFPLGGNWLMMGPTGPRRLRLAIEHLANIRGGVCYFVDLDPRWVKRCIRQGDFTTVREYKAHVIDQALSILRGRDIKCLFTTPLLLEALGEKISLAKAGIKGVFCGGTQMNPEMVRFLMTEVLENQVGFVPTYGNTLMGLACSTQVGPESNYSVSYYAPQPRALLRVVDPDNTNNMVNYESWGRVELTTLTKEFFMPRLLERDEALRKAPCNQYPWDGVADIRPFGASKKSIVEGVY